MGDKKDTNAVRIDTIIPIPDELKEITPVGILDLIFKKESKGKIMFLGVALYHLIEAMESDDKKIKKKHIDNAKEILASHGEHEIARKILNFIDM